MCGLGGYLNLKQQTGYCDRSLLEKMQQTVAHRGPNGYRIWIAENQPLGFFHRRLSIMDLSEAGFQPMFDQEHSVAVMCNGEIYNHPILRNRLKNLFIFQVCSSLIHFSIACIWIITSASSFFNGF
jgi:asparagine synthase (glutamine-hydrolysing)